MVKLSSLLVLGIDDDGLNGLPAGARLRLESADIVCGGHRQLSMLGPGVRESIPISAPMEAVYERLGRALAEGHQVTVLASGDPCCFGIGPLLVERFGRQAVEIVPSVSAIQLAFARLGEPWQEARLLSAHGRPVEGVIGPVLAARRSAILTDHVNTPAAIAQRLQACGLEDCRVVVGERLGGPRERIVESTLSALTEQAFDPLNVLLVLRSPEARLLAPRFGLADHTYAHRTGMITKAEVRAVSLSQLAIEPGDTVWDIGAGCGSVSLEASSLVQHGFVYAVERDPPQLGYLRENLAMHTGPIQIVHGEAPNALAALPSPNAVFLGGSGGRLDETLQVVITRLAPGGRLVANFVVLDHLLTCERRLQAAGWQTQVTQVAVSRGGALGRLEALNPVFVLAAGHVLSSR
ncbi:MAG: precorrin-6y C5,15-methyltransferase (decarboxylating) subunit CbiE [Chloroflexota bacterium]